MTPTEQSKSDFRLRDKLVGSWEFVRSTKEDATFDDLIYHFTSEDHSYWETFVNVDRTGKRMLTKPFLYRVEDAELILTWPNGKELRHLLLEEGKEIRMTGITGHLWWMIKLSEPKCYMANFVDLDGVLTKIQP